MLRDGLTAPRRVLLTLDAVGGVWRYVLDLAAALNERGIACLLAGFGPPPNQAQREACARAGAELVWNEAPLDWMVQDEAALAPVADQLNSLARAWGADLLHLHLPSQAVGLCVTVPIIASAHSCVPTWWQAVRRCDLPPHWQWQWRRNLAGLRRADAVLAPSKSHAALLQATYGPLGNLHVVHNTAHAWPSPAAEKDDFILAAGRWWDEGKNGRVLDEAAAASPWPVMLAGPLQAPDGQAAAYCAAQALGALPPDDMRALMHQAAIFAAPSLYEPFGLAVLEAASSGAALVLSDIPTFRELWDGAALFVQPDDGPAWACAFVSLAADASRRRRLAALARGRAAGFSAERQVEAVLDVYARQGRKQFFFEKRNQKTFANEQKFVASFFQKRRPCFLELFAL